MSMITLAPTSRAIAWAWRTMLRVSIFTFRGSGHGIRAVSSRLAGRCALGRRRLQGDVKQAEVVELVRVAGDAGLLEGTGFVPVLSRPAESGA